MNKIQFKTRKEVSDFLKEKNIDTTNWTEEKWQSINKSQAEIHMAALAEAMWDAYNESIPKKLKAGEWHIPFGDKMQDRDIMQHVKGSFNSRTEVEEAIQKFKIKIATARCARLSYMTFDGKIDYEKDLKLYDSLLTSHHMSPFEHCSRAMSDEEYYSFVKGQSITTTKHIRNRFTNRHYGWCNNFKGFIQYRHLLENKS